MTNTIKTMSELAEYINSHAEWQLEVSDIIERNGWHDETGEAYGVCSSDAEKVVMSENGQAEVIRL